MICKIVFPDGEFCILKTLDDVVEMLNEIKKAIEDDRKHLVEENVCAFCGKIAQGGWKYCSDCMLMAEGL